MSPTAPPPRPAPAPALSRRRLTRTLAWAAPVALAGVAAPAVAVSTPVVGGLAVYRSTCTTSGSTRTQRLEVEGSSSSTYGLWIDNVPQGAAPTAATFTVYFATSLGALTWTRSTTSTVWTLLTRDTTAPAIAGYTAYTARYTGTWTYVAATRRYRVTTPMPLVTTTRTVTTSTCPSVTIHVRRTVTWRGATYTGTSGPSTLQPTA